MLGKIRFGDGQSFLQFGDRVFPFAEKIEHTQTRWIRERFADAYLLFENPLVKLGGFPSSCRFQSGHPDHARRNPFRSREALAVRTNSWRRSQVEQTLMVVSRKNRHPGSVSAVQVPVL